MDPESTKRLAVNDLLERGLELYGRNAAVEAIRCWREVLALSPDEPRALEYLVCAGVPPEAPGGVVIDLHRAAEAPAARRPASIPPSSGASSGSRSGEAFLAALEPEVEAVDRGRLEQLLREKRYEDALLMLYRERAHAPDDPAISRGIRMLKEHLIVRYGRVLGGLDRVPVVTSPEALAELRPEQRHTLRLVDGLATFGDVLSSSPLGRFETSRLLAQLLERGVITSRAPSVVMSAVRAETPAAPPPPSSPPPSSDRGPSTQPSRVGVEGASTPPPAPPPSSTARARTPDEGYERLFAQATEAYLSRQYDEALRLYEACSALRPDDGRVANNLHRLRSRMGVDPTLPV